MNNEIIPKGWKKIKLKEVLTEISERNKGERVTIVLSVTNSKGFVNQEEYFEGTIHSTDISKYKIIRKNQFAYNPSRVNVGSIDILQDYEEGVLSPMYVVFEVDTTKLLPEYFKYYFQTNRFYENVKNNTQGSVRNSLSFKALADFDYLLPSITEQEKIVRILDNVDKIIKKIEKLKNNIKLSKKYIMNINFGKIINKGKRMKEVCTFFSGGTPSSQNKKYYEGDIPFIRSAEIDNCSTELKINDEGIKNSSAKIVKKGDLLLALYGANSGNVAISKIEGAINQAILCIRSNEIKIKYLKYLLEYDKNNILNKYLQGGQGNLSAEIIKNLKYDFQIKEEQEKIINILDLIENKINMIDILKEQYINVKKGLIQQLLTGKVRVKI